MHLNTRRVINIGFGVILTILVILTSANIFIIYQNNQTISKIDLKQKQAEDLFLMRNAVQRRALYLFHMTVLDDAFDRDDIFKIYQSEALKFMKAFEDLQSSESTDELKADWYKIKQLANLGSNIQNSAADIIYNEKFEEARKILSDKVIPVQKRVIENLTKQHYKQQDFLNNEINTIRTLNLNAFWIISVIGFIAIILGLGIAVYVSRHNKRFSDLEIQKQLAEEENEAKTDFLANMSHELRTPVHAILSYSKFGIRKESASREKIKGYFEHINASGTRLLSLVTSLLDLAKLESGKIDYTFTEENLKKILSECCDDLSSLSKEKNINVVDKTSEEIKTVECDGKLISQVFINLISNAIKFSNKNSNILIELSIAAEGSNSGDMVRFSIEDQGIGIPSAEHETIFDKFIQSSVTKTGSGGTGLGLSICSSIIEGHSGRIWAECTKEQGSRFVFEFPAKRLI